MKRKKCGLTIIEMLVVLGIIATIVGLLIPATRAVRRMAKNTQQRVQFTNIDVALQSWKNDFGVYPPSNYTDATGSATGYCGAQKLAIAMLGLDMRGYNPLTPLGGIDPVTSVDEFYGAGTAEQNNADGRQERYLETGVARPFVLDSDSTSGIPGLYDTTHLTGLIGNGIALTDVFEVKSVATTRTTPSGTIVETARAGSPILYFRANVLGSHLVPLGDGLSYADAGAIYNYEDNQALVEAKHLADGKSSGYEDAGDFYPDIQDPRVPLDGDGRAMPYRPDTYLLISAGSDGVYGTRDDIRNFGN